MRMDEPLRTVLVIFMHTTHTKKNSLYEILKKRDSCNKKNETRTNTKLKATDNLDAICVFNAPSNKQNKLITYNIT